MFQRVLCAVFALASAASMSAAEVTVQVQRHRARAEAQVAGKVTAQNATDPVKSLVFDIPGKLNLPNGEWFVTAQISGDWGEPRLVSVTDQPQIIELNTYPLARL